MPAPHKLPATDWMKQRLSAQLNDISATVLTLLSRSGLSVESFNYRTVYHPDIYGTDGKDNAIAFSRPMQADRQDLILYPIHAGSLFDLSVGVLDPKSQLDNHTESGTKLEAMSIEAISPFHAQFKPLPSDWPIDLYRKADRLVIALDDSVAESDIDAIAATLDFATSSTEHGLNSDNCTILLLCSDEQVLASSTRLKDKLASEGNWTLHAVVINQPSDYRALLSAATLCLYRSAIDCADSVSVGTPCLAWDSHEPGQPIRTRADIKFIGAPKHALDRLHTQGELQQLLQCWLELTCTDCADPSAPIINPAMDTEKQAVLADRMSTSLNQSHRKFRKFRESPSRFVNDSQSPLLRPFKNKRLSS